jgi:hypothetical protein
LHYLFNTTFCLACQTQFAPYVIVLFRAMFRKVAIILFRN